MLTSGGSQTKVKRDEKHADIVPRYLVHHCDRIQNYRPIIVNSSHVASQTKNVSTAVKKCFLKDMNFSFSMTSLPCVSFPDFDEVVRLMIFAFSFRM